MLLSESGASGIILQRVELSLLADSSGVTTAQAGPGGGCPRHPGRHRVAVVRQP